MKVYKTNEVKNISILGSSGAGKTTLAEAMLFEGGVIKRRGSIDAGNTVCDYFPVEKEYGYSVFSTVFSVEWQDKKLNFIDCPGADDFIGGTVSALNVTDCALGVVNAQYGGDVGRLNLKEVCPRYWRFRPRSKTKRKKCIRLWWRLRPKTMRA